MNNTWENRGLFKVYSIDYQSSPFLELKTISSSTEEKDSKSPFNNLLWLLSLWIFKPTNKQNQLSFY